MKASTKPRNHVARAFKAAGADPGPAMPPEQQTD